MHSISLVGIWQTLTQPIYELGHCMYMITYDNSIFVDCIATGSRYVSNNFRCIRPVFTHSMVISLCNSESGDCIDRHVSFRQRVQMALQPAEPI